MTTSTTGSPRRPGAAASGAAQATTRTTATSPRTTATTATTRTPPKAPPKTKMWPAERGSTSSRVTTVEPNWWGSARLDSPLTTYYLLVGATSILVVLGLVMVLSASSITSITTSSSHSPYTIFLNQAKYALMGLVAALVASRLSVRVWKLLAIPALVAAMGLQAMVFTRLGVDVNGNRNWIQVAGQRLQPSEFGKIALVLFAALVLTTKRRQLGDWKHAVVPLVFPAGLLLLGLVLKGRDLGTCLVLAAILVGVLFAAGVPSRVFFATGTLLAVAALGLALTNSNRLGRIDLWVRGCTNVKLCWQTTQGRYALADGGWWGVGLGASTEKWQWLPEAHNDFIFAIIGEELGLPGTLAVLALFAVLAFACYRLVRASTDHFVRIATAGVMTWVLFQAIVNIGAVIGLIPVIGVPLPLVSSGGSALLTTLIGLGMLIAFARREPACADALAARPGVVRRSLAVVAGGRPESAHPAGTAGTADGGRPRARGGSGKAGRRRSPVGR